MRGAPLAICAALLLVPCAAAPVAAQSDVGAGRKNEPSPLPGGGTTRDLTMPGNGGVAGTGLGGSTDGTGNGAVSGKPSGDTGAAGVPGTGGSVKGPAGQGIAGQGTSDGIAPSSAGGSGPAGSTGGSSGTGSSGTGGAAGGGAAGAAGR